MLQRILWATAPQFIDWGAVQLRFLQIFPEYNGSLIARPQSISYFTGFKRGHNRSESVNTPGLVSRGCPKKKKDKEENKLYVNGRSPVHS